MCHQGFGPVLHWIETAMDLYSVSELSSSQL